MVPLDDRVARLLEAFDSEEIPEKIPTSLPLLDELRNTYPEPAAFENLDTLFIQHHLGPFKARVEAMREDGMSMDRTWFVDIPYSTCGEARDAVQDGCPQEHTLEAFTDPLEPYSETQLTRVLVLLRDIGQEKRGRLLVVDDGAYFLRALRLLRLTRPSLAQSFRGACVVEQTTRGHRVVERCAGLIHELGLSVVSVARCHTKLEFESPFIGAAVARAITRAVEGNEGLTGRFRRAAVLGFGAVGAAVTRSLRRAFPELLIDVVDPDRKKRALIDIPGVCPLHDLPDSVETENSYDLVAGCTGYNSFRLHQRRLLAKNALLASGSSAAVEFNRAGFIELADAFPDDEIEVLDRESIQSSIHSTIALAHEGGKIMHFLNAGFPVNFDGRMECLPARAIQATHCLMFHAARQALRQETPGVSRLDGDVDAWLLKQAPSHL